MMNSLRSQLGARRKRGPTEGVVRVRSGHPHTHYKPITSAPRTGQRQHRPGSKISNPYDWTIRSMSTGQAGISGRTRHDPGDRQPMNRRRQTPIHRRSHPRCCRSRIGRRRAPGWSASPRSQSPRGPWHTQCARRRQSRWPFARFAIARAESPPWR